MELLTEPQREPSASSATGLKFNEVWERGHCAQLSEGLPTKQISCGFFRCSFATEKNAAEK